MLTPSGALYMLRSSRLRMLEAVWVACTGKSSVIPMGTLSLTIGSINVNVSYAITEWMGKLCPESEIRHTR